MTFQSGDVVQISGQTINMNIASGGLFIYANAVSSQVITIVSGMYINSGQYQISGQYLSSGQAITNIVAGSGAVSVQMSGTVAQINVSGGGGGQLSNNWCHVYSDTTNTPTKDLAIFGNSEATMLQHAGSGSLCQWQTSGTCSGITATVGTSGRFLFTINASGVYYAIARATHYYAPITCVMSFQKSGVELADSCSWLPGQNGGPPNVYNASITDSLFRAIPGETIKWFFSGEASNIVTYTPSMTILRVGD